MKLEPGRSSLSGRVDAVGNSPSITSAVSAVPLPAQIRKCSTCGIEDVAHAVQGQYEPGGEQALEHLVTIELRFLKKPEDLTARMKARGWRGITHVGCSAMQRFICRPCLEAHRIMDREFSAKRTNELKSSSQQDNYYTAVCGE